MITEGQAKGIEPQTIATGKKIPNVAVFLKRTGLEFLQAIFSSRSDYKYDPDDSVTGIQIADSHAVDLSSLNVRPAIVAVRGPMSWRNLGLGGGAVESRNMRTGSYTFKDLLTGSLSFNVLSREGIEAEQIAHVVFNSFKFFRPELQRYGFFSIEALSMGGETLIEQEGTNDETHAVSISMTATVEDRWRLSDQVARTIKKIVIETLTNF